MDPDRRVLEFAGVAVKGTQIVAVGPVAELRLSFPDAQWLDEPGGIITPGYIDAHQHLTGDRLIRSTIPDSLTAEQAIYEWAVPVHTAQTPSDEQLAAALACIDALRNGVTTVLEAGTVHSYDQVATAMERTGIRGTVATWGWDLEGAPFALHVEDVLTRQSEVLDAFPPGVGRVRGSVALVGHDVCSDELYRQAAQLARARGALLTFHLSIGETEVAAFSRRSGRRPVLHLADLGVLGPGVLVAHALHIDSDELDTLVSTDTAIASCPWTYLRLAAGLHRAGRHHRFVERGGRLALGCDSENSGDLIDVLRTAALWCGVERDRVGDPVAFDAKCALELATIAGARAIGRGDDLGSLEVGKCADIVVHRPDRLPLAGDPYLELIWGTDGRSVVHVIVDGALVVQDRTVLTMDVAQLAEVSERARADLVARADLAPRSDPSIH
jgi:5-methylthioadenosine/S-adenosylhomocysteine deaminase